MSFLNLNTYFLIYLQWIGGLISVALIIFILYLTVKMNIIGFKIERWIDILMGASKLVQYRAVKNWRKILRKLQSRNQTDWRDALLLADQMLDEILKMAGYEGKNLSERLNNISPAQISNIKNLRQVHQLTLRLKENPEYPLNKETTDEAVYEYRKAFEELRLLN